MYRFARLRAAPMLGHKDHAAPLFAPPTRCGSGATARIVLDRSGNKHKQDTCQLPNTRYFPGKGSLYPGQELSRAERQQVGTSTRYLDAHIFCWLNQEREPLVYT